MSQRRGTGATTRAPAIPEPAWQQQVLDWAHVCGWLTYHTFDSRRSTAGYPDLSLVRGDRHVFAELKAETGRMRPEQLVWLNALAYAVPEVYVWRPSHWPYVEKLLARNASPATWGDAQRMTMWVPA